jgi:hypothetical protein
MNLETANEIRARRVDIASLHTSIQFVSHEGGPSLPVLTKPYSLQASW